MTHVSQFGTKFSAIQENLSIDGGAVSGVTEQYTVTSLLPAGSAQTLTLNNTVADSQVILFISGYALSLTNYENVAGTRTVNFNVPAHFDINPGDVFEIHYHRSNNVPVVNSVVLNDITGVVNADGSITISYDVTNTGDPRLTRFIGEITDGGTNTQNQTSTVLVASGNSVITFTYTNLPPATYDYTDTGDLQGTVNDLVVPSYATNFIWDNYRTVLVDNAVNCFVDIHNTGNLGGNCITFFEKDNEIYSVNEYLAPGQSKTVGYTFIGLSPLTYIFTGYESDGTTVIGTETIIISNSEPVEIPLQSAKAAQKLTSGGSYSYWYNNDPVFGYGGIGEYRSWLYFDTSNIVGTVTSVSLMLRNLTWTDSPKPATISASAYTTQQNAQLIWNDTAGSNYGNVNPTMQNNTTAEYVLNAAAISKVNLKNGFYINLRRFTGDGIKGSTFSLTTLKLTY